MNSTFSYAFPVSSGGYTVNLYFAEVNFTAVGSRVFDIFIEGVLVKDNFDIVKKVGPNAATAKVFSKTITDGTLNITFSSLLSDGGVFRLPCRRDRSATGIRRSLWYQDHQHQASSIPWIAWTTSLIRVSAGLSEPLREWNVQYNPAIYDERSGVL